MSAIEWTEKTWNPTVGCSIVSTECRECYAMKMAHRLAAMGQEKYQDLTEVVNGNVVWNGTVRLDPDALGIPLQFKRRKVFFVNSMSDLFHESLSYEDIERVFDVMLQGNQHIYQILTKRPERMKAFVDRFLYPALLPNVLEMMWLGTSVGYKPAKDRIEHLRNTQAVTRFLSCEPLLEDLGELDLSGIDWVIVGGESGPKARMCRVEWVMRIVEQCRQQNVKVFVKQLGAYAVLDSRYDQTISGATRALKHSKGGDMDEWPEELRIREFPA